MASIYRQFQNAKRFCLEEEHIDDLLELVEGAYNTKSTKTTTEKQGKKDDKQPAKSKDFLDDLLPQNEEDEEEDTGGYVPSQRDSKAGPKKLSAELKQKMGQFFGVGLSKSISQDLGPPMQTAQRAQTSEGRLPGFNRGISAPPIENMQQSESLPQSGIAQQGEPAIEEFTVNVSRRKGRTATLRDREKGTSSRPQTTPADSRNYTLDAPNRDDESKTAQDNFSNFDGASTNYGAGENPADRDGEDHQSDYIPSSLARTQKRGSSKFLSPPINNEYDPTGILPAPIKEESKRHQAHKATFGQLNREDTAPAISPIDQQERGSPAFKPRFFDRPPILDQAIGVQPTFQPTIQQAQPKTEASVPGLEEFLSQKQFGGTYERQTLGEEALKKMLKETDEYYKNMIEELRKHHNEERTRMDENYRQTVEMHQKEKQLLLEQMEVNLQRERERLKDLHKQEIESLERLHKHEIQREKHYASEHSENLKKQLEAQIRMNALAEEFRQSSSKINMLFERTGPEENHARTRAIETKERLLGEKEMKMNSELQVLEREKKRYEKLFVELEAKESEITRKAEEESSRIKREYSRLLDLQNQIKEKEVEMKKGLIQEKTQFELLAKQKERESEEIVEEYKRKFKELAIQRELFEAERKEFRAMVERTERDLQEKQRRTDEKSYKIDALEADLHKRAKGVEQRDLETVQALDRLRTKTEQFESERSEFEREKLKVYEIAKHTREDAEATNKFKREFDTERDRLTRMRAELDAYSVSLRNERLALDQQQAELTHLKKMMEGTRYEYVKSLDIGSPMSGTTRDSMLQPSSPEKLRKMPSATSQAFFLKQQLSPTVVSPQPVSKMGLSSTFSAQNLRSQVSSPKIPGSTHSRSRPNSKGSFDFNGYMRELRNLGQSNLINGDYISKERELLVQNKTEIETTNFKRALKTVKLEVEIL